MFFIASKNFHVTFDISLVIQSISLFGVKNQILFFYLLYCKWFCGNRYITSMRRKQFTQYYNKMDSISFWTELNVFYERVFSFVLTLFLFTSLGCLLASTIYLPVVNQKLRHFKSVCHTEGILMIWVNTKQKKLKFSIGSSLVLVCWC